MMATKKPKSMEEAGLAFHMDLWAYEHGYDPGDMPEWIRVSPDTKNSKSTKNTMDLVRRDKTSAGKKFTEEELDGHPRLSSDEIALAVGVLPPSDVQPEVSKGNKRKQGNIPRSADQWDKDKHLVVPHQPGTIPVFVRLSQERNNYYVLYNRGQRHEGICTLLPLEESTDSNRICWFARYIRKDGNENRAERNLERSRLISEHKETHSAYKKGSEGKTDDMAAATTEPAVTLGASSAGNLGRLLAAPATPLHITEAKNRIATLRHLADLLGEPHFLKEAMETEHEMLGHGSFAKAAEARRLIENMICGSGSVTESSLKAWMGAVKEAWYPSEELPRHITETKLKRLITATRSGALKGELVPARHWKKFVNIFCAHLPKRPGAAENDREAARIASQCSKVSDHAYEELAAFQSHLDAGQAASVQPSSSPNANERVDAQQGMDVDNDEKIPAPADTQSKMDTDDHPQAAKDHPARANGPSDMDVDNDEGVTEKPPAPADTESKMDTDDHPQVPEDHPAPTNGSSDMDVDNSKRSAKELPAGASAGGLPDSELAVLMDQIADHVEGMLNTAKRLRQGVETKVSARRQALRDNGDIGFDGRTSLKEILHATASVPDLQSRVLGLQHAVEFYFQHAVRIAYADEGLMEAKAVWFRQRAEKIRAGMAAATPDTDNANPSGPEK